MKLKLEKISISFKELNDQECLYFSMTFSRSIIKYFQGPLNIYVNEKWLKCIL